MDFPSRYFNISGFSRSYGASVEELKFFNPFLPDESGVMIDVGSHHGESFAPFLGKSWKAYGFEPDPRLYAELVRKYGGHRNLTLENMALSDKEQGEAPWFTTPDSDGAGTMQGFTNKHKRAGSVRVATLRSVIRNHDISHVDLLKIDAEGFDFRVLKGFPFELMKPQFIICEFEDKKTTPLDYTTEDMASFLVSKGYTVYVSEWHPIIRYGIRHQWYGFRSWPSKLANPAAWGNLLAFSCKPDEFRLFKTVENNINRYQL